MKRTVTSLIMLAFASLLAGCGNGGTPVAPATPSAEPVPVKTAGAAPEAKTTGAPADTSSVTTDTSGVTIKEVTLHKDNGKGEVGEQTDAFLPTDQVHHFAASTSQSLATGTKVKWVFTGLDTTAGKNVSVANFVVEVGKLQLIANRLTANVKLPREWPVGTFKAEIFFDDKLAKSFKYVVTPPAGEYVIGGLILYHDNGKGQPGEQVKAFKSTNRNHHLALVVGGHIPPGSLVRWSFTAVDTSAGKGVKLGDIDGKLPDFGKSVLNTLTSNVEFPRDWPTGSYKVDVQVNGKLIHTVEFKVE